MGELRVSEFMWNDFKESFTCGKCGERKVGWRDCPRECGDDSCGALECRECLYVESDCEYE